MSAVTKCDGCGRLYGDTVAQLHVVVQTMDVSSGQVADAEQFDFCDYECLLHWSQAKHEDEAEEDADPEVNCA